MEGIIKLLKEKNHFLKKFFILNKAEIYRLTDGDFKNVEQFYRSRETILETIGRIDILIEEGALDLGKIEATDDHKKTIQALFEFKDELVGNILDQDLQILSLIEGEKSRLLRELTTVRKNRQGIGAYRSRKNQKGISEEA